MSTQIKTFKMRGTVKFANLLTPKSFDPSSNKFVEDTIKGAYGVSLLLDKTKENEDIIRDLKIHVGLLYTAYCQSDAYQSKKSKKELQPSICGISNDIDECNKPTGKYLVRFKRNAQNKDGKVAQIKFYNAVKQPYILTDEIGSGSDIVIQYCVYDNAIDGREKIDGKLIDITNHYSTFCILGVQVVNHKLYSGDNSWMEGDDSSENIDDKEYLGIQ